MNDTKTMLVTIQGVESTDIPKFNSTVFNLKTNEGDFNFWKTKKDGDNTVAYNQYQKFRFVAGDEVEVIYKEVDASYNHKVTGKKIEKTNRTIVKFNEDDDIPTKSVSPGPERPISKAADYSTSAPQSSQEILKDIAFKVDMIFEILNNNPPAKNSIPIVDVDEDTADINAELGAPEDEVNADDLGF